jgi:iron transport multicopper oxidase
VWQINGITYISPVVPTLVKILDGASTDADFNQTENTFVFPQQGYPGMIFPPEYDTCFALFISL